MSIDVADAMQISKNLSLEIRKSAVPSAAPKMLKRSFRSSAPRVLKDPLPALPPAPVVPPAIRAPAVRAGNKALLAVKFKEK
jgi:hypothetical protein